MKRMFIAASTLVLLSIGTPHTIFDRAAMAAPEQAAQVPTPEQQVEHVNITFLRSQVTVGAVENFKRLVADDAILIRGAGTVLTKEQFLQGLQQLQATVGSVATENVRIKVQGQTAVVLGDMVITGATGNKIHNMSFLTCFARRDDRWQIVMSQLAPKSAGGGTSAGGSTTDATGQNAAGNGAPGAATKREVAVGALPPALVGTDLDGNVISLDDYKGKVVLLDFWASWCPPCRKEMPNVQGQYNQYHDQGFEIVGISFDKDKQAMVDYIRQNQMPWRQTFLSRSESNANIANYGVKGIPFSVLIGKDGKIASVNPRGEKLEPAIQAALAQ